MTHRNSAVDDSLALYARLRDITGWFNRDDVVVLTLVDQLQRQHNCHGDILEIGAYHGKSAIFLRSLCRENERLYVCDLFGEPVSDSANSAENLSCYRGLQRDTFEDNYASFYDDMPTIFQCGSDQLSSQQFRQPLRLAHIDGSHLYPVVRSDIALARKVMGEGAFIVVDDINWAPGVAAAAWEAAFTDGLRPVCFTESKMYATPSPVSVKELAQLAREVCPEVGLLFQQQRIRDYDILRFYSDSGGLGILAAVSHCHHRLREWLTTHRTSKCRVSKGE